jgi:hypothetical protein
VASLTFFSVTGVRLPSGVSATGTLVSSRGKEITGSGGTSTLRGIAGALVLGFACTMTGAASRGLSRGRNIAAAKAANPTAQPAPITHLTDCVRARDVPLGDGSDDVRPRKSCVRGVADGPSDSLSKAKGFSSTGGGAWTTGVATGGETAGGAGSELGTTKTCLHFGHRARAPTALLARLSKIPQPGQGTRKVIEEPRESPGERRENHLKTG